MTQIEIKLKKEEIEILEKTIESLRNDGYSHCEVGGEFIVFSCEELIKNKEEYEKDLERIKTENLN